MIGRLFDSSTGLTSTGKKYRVYMNIQTGIREGGASMSAVAKGVVILAGVTLIVLTSVMYWKNRTATKTGSSYFMPMIQQEWARRAEDMGEKPTMGSLWSDSIAFIPMYIFVLYTLATHLQNSAKVGNGNIYFYTIITCTIIAALADWTENYFIYRVSFTEATPTFFDIKYYACFIKWLFIGIAVLLTSLGFLAERNAWVGILGLVNAFILIYGTIANPALIQWGFGMMGLVILITSLFL
jgi:hypothetical protein